jgi:short-subunit dehydrogenase
MSSEQRPLVFITGASSGIGQALAARYLAAGFDLALVARRVHETQAWARALGIDPQRYRIYSADVSVPDSIVGAAQQCLQTQGLPAVVIASAGVSIGMDSRVREDLDVMQQTLNVNLLGTAATFHPFIAPMLARGSGRLVGVASVAAIRGLPGHGAYCASKSGLVAYCESLRGELRAQSRAKGLLPGVQVVTIVPGYIDTPLTRANQYSMPFLMPVEVFANKAFQAIEAGQSYRVIPWQMGVVAKLLRALPNGLYDRLLAGRPRKPRRGE